METKEQKRKPMSKDGQFYASIFEYFLFHKELKPGAKVLLAALHAKSFRNKDLLSGKCQATVSQKTLAENLGFKRRSIQYWLDALVKVNAIHVTCRKNENKPNIYTLLLPPKAVAVLSPSNKPQGGELDTQAKNENTSDGI